MNIARLLGDAVGIEAMLTELQGHMAKFSVIFLPESDAQAILDTMTADDNFLLRGSEALLQSIADAAVAESQDSSRLFA